MGGLDSHPSASPTHIGIILSQDGTAGIKIGREDGHGVYTGHDKCEPKCKSRKFKGTMSYANLTRSLSDPTHR